MIMSCKCLLGTLSGSVVCASTGQYARSVFLKVVRTAPLGDVEKVQGGGRKFRLTWGRRTYRRGH